VLTGRLLPTERVRSTLDLPWPMFDQPMAYGQGLMLYEVPEPGRPLTWIGHSGGASGVKAAMVWSPVDQAYAAVALTGPGSAEAAANALLRTRGRR
jgi:D-alanyl-D-alanine carboxypeptidase